MVLSRLPVSRPRFTPYRLAGLPQRPLQGDFYGGKGFVSLELTTDPGPVTLIDTHLQAGYGEPAGSDENLGIRAGQALQLAGYIHGLQTPVLAVGDFNSAEGAAAYKILAGVGGLGDLAVDLDRREATCLYPHPYRPAQARESRIDLIFARSGQEIGVRPIGLQRTYDQALEFAGEPGAYSDHAGLIGEVELVSRSAGEPPFPGSAPSASALEHADLQLRRGEEAARQRRRREMGQAGGLLGAGLLVGGGAWKVREKRRRFLTRLALGVGGIGFVGGLVGAAGSQWATENEIAGFAELREILARLRPVSGEPVRIRTP